MVFVAPGCALGYYFLPPRWLGAELVPFGELSSTDPLSIDLSALKEVIVEVDLPQGLRSRAYRDGMLAYDFAPWAALEGGAVNFEIIDRQLGVINAHLACLAGTTDRYMPALIATLETTATMAFDAEALEASQTVAAGTMRGFLGGLGPMLHSLESARVERPPNLADWRFSRMSATISQESLEKSYTLLAKLLELSGWERAIARADLLWRAESTRFERDHSGALVYAWTAIEGLLGDLWSRYLKRRQSEDLGRGPRGQQKKAMTSDRRQEIEGEKVTSWHMTEFLSLAGELPDELYEAIGPIRKARNAWLHNERPATSAQAVDGLRLVRRLFGLVEGVDLAAELPTSDP